MQENSIDDLVYPSDVNPFNLSLAKWTAEWWKWLHSIPMDLNPASDTTGKFSNSSQIYPKVCFLAGTFGGSVFRKCVIEYGKALFFPIITSIYSFILDPHLKTEQELSSAVSSDVDTVDCLTFSFDKKKFSHLDHLRVRSEPFDDVINGMKTVTVSDGYWIFLKPPTVGGHTLHFMGKNSKCGFFNEVTYNLEISPNHSPH